MPTTCPARTDGDRHDPGAVVATLEDLATRLDAVVATLDPEVLMPEVALRTLRLLARVGRAANSGEALVAPRVEATCAYAAGGFASTAQALAESAGTTLAHASTVVDTGRQLAAHHRTAEAVRHGHISVEQAHAVAAAATADPKAEADLLAVAATESVRRLRDRARDVRLAADDDRLGRYRRQQAARSLRHGRDDDGMVWGRFHLPPDVGAAVVHRLERQADREYRAASSEGRREPHDRHLADALVRLCTASSAANGSGADSTADVGAGTTATSAAAPLAPGVRADVVVHVSHAALRRGRVAPGEVCQVQGAGPVPVEVARDLLDGDAFLTGVLVDGTDVRAVRRFGRRRSAALRTALEVREVLRDGDVRCAAPGCDRHLGVEWDHEHPVAAGGLTSYDNLRPLCRAHHRHKSESDRRRTAAGPDP